MSDNEILAVYTAALSAGLAESRQALLGHLGSALPTTNVPRMQLMSDLKLLNEAGSLEDGTIPLERWLKWAVASTHPRREAAVFTNALKLLDAQRATIPPTPDWPWTLPEPADPVATLWSQLESASNEHATQPHAALPEGLALHDWKEVQPRLATLLLAPSPSRVALTGRGGAGKTFVMKALLHQGATDIMTIYWTGDDLREIVPNLFGDVLERVRRQAQAQGKRAVVLIDSCENATDSPDGRKNLLAVMARASQAPGLKVVLTMRSTAWNQISNSLSNWGHVELDEWPEEVVLAEVGASQRPQITRDLIRILRTPLMLDLFLRTFGKSSEVPEGLQTRHSVLSAYFARWIWPDGTPEAHDCRQILLRCADEEAKGRRAHGGPESGYRVLASEGVFDIERGLYVFRHALLRDFAIMVWAVDGGLAQLAPRLTGISRGLVQFGAVRALIEASCDRKAATATFAPHDEAIELTQLVPAFASDLQTLLMVAEAVGELEDPAPIDFREIVDALTPAADAAAFAGRVLNIARLTQNAGWLDRIAALPNDRLWAEQTGWMSSGLVGEIASYLEVLWRVSREPNARPELESACRGVARRLRTWSTAPRIHASMVAEDRLALRALIQTICEAEPTSETIEWLDAYASGSSWARHWIGESLPKLVARARLKQIRLDGTRVEALYLKASGLRWHEQLIQDQPDVEHDSLRDFVWIDKALLGSRGGAKGTPGLVGLLPAEFLPIAMGRLAANAEAELAASQRWLEEAFGEIHAENSAEPDASVLVSDVYALTHGVQLCDQSGAIILALRSWLEDALERDENEIATLFWPAARVSRSTATRALLLDFLVTASGVRQPAVVDKILCDPRVYLDAAMAYYLWRAIGARWAALDDVVKSRTLDNIAALAPPSSHDGANAIAPLLCAIPSTEQPAELRPILELYEAQGVDPAPPRPSYRRGQAQVRPVSSGQRAGLHTRLYGLTPDCLERWQRASAWDQNDLFMKPEARAQASNELKEILDGCLPERDVLVQNPWVLTSIAMLLEALEESDTEWELTADEVRRLAEATFGILESTNVETTNRVWEEALSLLDRVLAHPSFADDVATFGRLLDIVAKVSEAPSPSVARLLFTRIRPHHWLVDRDRGLDLLRSLLLDRVRDGKALSWALRLLDALSPTEKDPIFSAWLEARREPPLENAGDFAEDLGIHLGGRAVQSWGEPKLEWARGRVEYSLSSQASEGLLSERATRVRYIKGVVFGAKEAFKKAPDLNHARAFAGLMTSAWDALAGLSMEESREFRFSLFAFDLIPPDERHPQGKQLDGAQLWQAMEPLARRIVTEGNTVQIFDLIFSRRDEQTIRRLGPRMLRGVVEALAKRVEREPRENLLAQTGHLNGGWLEILEYASELLEHVGLAVPDDLAFRDQIFGILQKWSQPPLDVKAALSASLKVRS